MICLVLEDRKLDEKYGVNVDLIKFPRHAEQYAALKAGKVNAVEAMGDTCPSLN